MNRLASTAEAVLAFGLYQNPRNGEVVMPLVRSDAWNPQKWRVVGGGVEDGETLVQATEREHMEETGLIITNLRPWKVIKKPSRNEMYKEHIQTVMIGEIPSLEGLKLTSRDGEEILTTKMFNTGQIQVVLRFSASLDYYSILPFHGNIIKEVFSALFD